MAFLSYSTRRVCKRLAAPVRCLIAVVGMGVVSAVGWAGEAIAADQVVITYGMLSASFDRNDLETLATTDTVPNSIAPYLDLANLDAIVLRTALTTEVNLSLEFLDDLLNSQTGDRVLDQVVQVIHTPSQQGSLQALRSAIVLSASDDDQLSLLELIENYPTEQMMVDGVNLLQFAREFENSEEDSLQADDIPQS